MNYSTCSETGLMVCEVFPLLLVREDGMIKRLNSHPQSRGNFIWYAGVTDSKGYYRVHTKTTSTKKVHQLVGIAFIENPNNFTFIDHIDGNPANNHSTNLRWCSNRFNQGNQIRHRNGALLGTSYRSKVGNWVAKIGVDGKQLHLGTFKTAEEAHEKYLQALKEYDLH